MNKVLWPILLRTITFLVIVQLAIFISTYHYNLTSFSVLLLVVPFLPATINFLFLLKLAGLFKHQQNVFFRKYLLNSGLKFLINIILFVVLIFLFRSNPLPIIVVYLLSYLVFFILEIIEIQVLNRKMK